MIESRIRPCFDKFLVEPAVGVLRYRVTPDTMTLLSLLTGIGAAALISFDYRIAAVALLLFSGYLDILDGALARFQNASSPAGTMLDILSDRMVESFIIIGFFIRQSELGLVSLLMLMSIIMCVSSFLLVGIFTDKSGQKSFYYSDGLMERGEVFIVFITMMILPQINIYVGLLFTVLVLWTAIYRTWEFKKNLRVNS
ncbi:MAG: CDP-alcohol phosphatidyltransferase family protein [Lentisphaerae bacterium]|nr:CDP-alcohol phosphatidyltransferase family protein [Lentisphaerota bacterium]MCP4102111.1 CDP-alcohol phosphatidyltransferase family protein [Lentisphaerota bacterium]